MSDTHKNIADEVMCACSGNTRGQICDLFMQGKDIDAISRWTGAKTGCGGCEWDIEVFVKALAEAAK
ncbi:MAG: (2Fe-2S)-binding protein [Methylophilaceae bacterium]